MKSENRSRGLASWAILLSAKVMHLYDKSKKSSTFLWFIEKISYICKVR